MTGMHTLFDTGKTTDIKHKETEAIGKKGGKEEKKKKKKIDTKPPKICV